MDQTILSATGLSKLFGNLAALESVDIAVKNRQIHGLIGPNGSGKTTFVNVVTGFYPPTKGKIHFNGTDITSVKPNIIAAKTGISRTYQLGQIFPMMTCLQNVMAGAHRRITTGMLRTVFQVPFKRSPEEEDLKHQASELLKFVGLTGYAERWAEGLSWMECQLLQIARALASEPKFLMLDEPTAGMGPDESQRVARIIQEVRNKGIAVMLISHDVKLVTTLADWITVLEFGQKICEGLPNEVINDCKVLEAYLGER